MVLLLNKEFIEEIVIFNEDDFTFENYKIKYDDNFNARQVYGFFTKFKDMFIAVYGKDGCLLLVVNQNLFEIKDSQVIEVSGDRTNRRLSITENGEVLTEFQYSLVGKPAHIPGDITPFVEDEDFDIGLMASNISKDLERKKRFCCRSPK